MEATPQPLHEPLNASMKPEQTKLIKLWNESNIAGILWKGNGWNTQTPKNGLNFDASGHLNLHWDNFVSCPDSRPQSLCWSFWIFWSAIVEEFLEAENCVRSSNGELSCFLKESLGHPDDSDDERRTVILLPNGILLCTLYIDPHYTSTQVFHCNPPFWREPSGQSLFSVPRMLGCFFFCTARFESNTWTKVGHLFQKCIKVFNENQAWKIHQR